MSFPEHILKENLTVIPQFHSHLEPMRNVGDLDQQITLSFSEDNTISLDGPFSKQVDSTRYFFFFLSFLLDELITNDVARSINSFGSRVCMIAVTTDNIFLWQKAMILVLNKHTGSRWTKLPHICLMFLSFQKKI